MQANVQTIHLFIICIICYKCLQVALKNCMNILKDVFQSVLHSLNTLCVFKHYKSHSKDCKSILNFCYKSRTLIFEAFQILFLTASLLSTAAKLFHHVI